MDRLFCLRFLSIYLVFFSLSTAQAGVPRFCDFEKQRDSSFLEQIFKEHWNLLINDYRKHSYKYGQGVAMFSLCSNIKGTSGVGKILLSNNETVGFLTFFIAHQGIKQYNKLVVEKGEGCIPLMGIGSNYQKKGYGSYLLMYILSELKGQGCKTVKLSVHDSNTDAQKLYRKFQFYNIHESALSTEQGDGCSWWKLNNLDKINLEKLIKKDHQ